MVRPGSPSSTKSTAKSRGMRGCGAGSITASNLLYNKSPKDGSTFGAIFMGAVTEPLTYRLDDDVAQPDRDVEGRVERDVREVAEDRDLGIHRRRQRDHERREPIDATQRRDDVAGIKLRDLLQLVGRTGCGAGRGARRSAGRGAGGDGGRL